MPQLKALDLQPPLPGAWCPRCRDHTAITHLFATELDGWAQSLASMDVCPECQWSHVDDMAELPERCCG